MKKILPGIIYFLVCVFSTQGQTLYGTTYGGGDHGGGTINKFVPATNTLTVLKSFGSGTFVSAGLTQAGDGKLYGMTTRGGTNGTGTIFSYDPTNSAYTNLKDFDGINGAGPNGSLILASDGKLYGMTTGGGSNGGGVIFSYDPSTSVYTKVWDFDADVHDGTGANPYGSLMQASDGKLYGTTRGGGTCCDDDGGCFGGGVIFSFDPSSSTYAKLHDFGCRSNQPVGSLIQANDGKLYGMTSGTGGYNFVIFSFDPSTFTYTILQGASYENSISAYGSLVQSKDGKLYGMTEMGGSRARGIIFSVDLSSSTYTKLRDFDDVNGAHPYGNLTEASDGLLYGMTNAGGTSDKGVIFSFDPSSSTYTKLQDFNGINGAHTHDGSAFIEINDSSVVNRQPTTSLIIPANIPPYHPAGNIFLKAIASDPDGTISKVEFYNGTTLLHTETVVPYTFKGTDVPEGKYILNVKATDNKGLTTTSFPVGITVVPNTLPVVKITSPAAGGSYPASATIGLSADAYSHGASIQEVKFYLQNTLLHTEKNRPFLWNWNNVPQGNYMITAKAIDTLGRVGISAPVNVAVISNTTLTVKVTSPAAGTVYVEGDSIVLSAVAGNSADTIKSVDFYYGNRLIFSGLKAPYQTTWTPPVGDYYITAVATGNNGMKITSAPVYIKVFPLKVNITSPAAGATYTQPAVIVVSVEATARIGTIKEVAFYSGTTLLSTVQKVPYLFNWDNAPVGNDTITAKATDSYGHTSISAPVSVTVLPPPAPVTLYGATFDGGNKGGGTINKFISGSNNLTTVKSLDGGFPADPRSNLIQATDGKLYGMTVAGGKNDEGVIFFFDPATSTSTILRHFGGINGARPIGSLMQATDGKLYGMTFYGGNSHYGVIFSFDPSSSTYTKLKDFGGTDGANPYGSLIQATDGKLYGMAGGGSSGAGVIFSFDPVSSTYTKLKDFDGTNGARAEGSLMQASDGILYGMTTYGGKNSWGAIFSFNPSSSTYTKLKDFGGIDGANPHGSLVQASDGKLYGMTANGGTDGKGVIFSFDLFSSAFTKLKDFKFTYEANPNGSLIQASNGKLYGMAAGPGFKEQGVIFSFVPSTLVYTVLKKFNHADGYFPTGSVIQASDGKLYGMTNRGGSSDFGVVFSLDPSSRTYTTVNDFASNESGSNVSGSLMRANNGKLYGMTNIGGSYGNGVIFSLDPTSSVYTKLKDFDNIAGGNPKGSMVQANDGKLYGMTYAGGSSNLGVIFSFDPSSSAYTKLKDFDSAGGVNPYGSLIQARDGKLYGMTAYGGSNGVGVIFSFDLSSSTYTKLKDFGGNDGYLPYGSLIESSDGKLYGMTQGGGINDAGVIFSFDRSSFTYTKMKDFDATISFPYGNGAFPYGDLMQASDGKFYGMTFFGGISDAGVFFSFDPVSFTYTKLKNFGGTDGANPYGSLMQASDGKLYGMTLFGGNSDKGVIFSFDPLSSTYTKLKDYDGTNGADPRSGFIEITDPNVNTPSKERQTTAGNTKYLPGESLNFNGDIKLVPNPAHNILTIYTTGFQKNKRSTISIISSSGVTLQTKQLNNLTPTIQLNIISLSGGLYIIKMVCGDKVMYRQFVKM